MPGQFNLIVSFLIQSLTALQLVHLIFQQLILSTILKNLLSQVQFY